jgi:hypothetical protein
MTCKPECKPIGRQDWDGMPFMISQPGNSKMKSGTVHKQCMECAREKSAKAIREMAAGELKMLKATGKITNLSQDQIDDLQNRLFWGQ